MALTKKEYEALANTSELREYERLHERAREAYEKLQRVEADLEEFEENWKDEVARESLIRGSWPAYLERRLEKMMDSATRAHFEKWLDHAVRDEDREETVVEVVNALKDDPDLVDRGLSWAEIAARGK